MPTKIFETKHSFEINSKKNSILFSYILWHFIRESRSRIQKITFEITFVKAIQTKAIRIGDKIMKRERNPFEMLTYSNFVGFNPNITVTMK